MSLSGKGFIKDALKRSSGLLVTVSEVGLHFSCIPRIHSLQDARVCGQKGMFGYKVDGQDNWLFERTCDNAMISRSQVANFYTPLVIFSDKSRIVSREPEANNPQIYHAVPKLMNNITALEPSMVEAKPTSSVH